MYAEHLARRDYELMLVARDRESLAQRELHERREAILRGELLRLL
jgi:short-subunit dehydrogenase